jgi:hypothetical protein
MPNDPTTWIVAIVVFSAVVAFAIWRGDFVEFQLRPFKLRFKRHSRASAPEDGEISIGKGITVSRSRVGDIAGIKSSESIPTQGVRLSVGDAAKIEASEVGDIVGVKTGEPTPASKAKQERRR